MEDVSAAWESGEQFSLEMYRGHPQHIVAVLGKSPARMGSPREQHFRNRPRMKRT